MKKLTIIYWIVTGLLFAVMLMASITDLLHIPAAVEGFKHLGYPVYLLSFLGVARILGIPEEESDMLLTLLFAHVLEPRFMYRHQWRSNDLVFWDNRALIHRATPLPPGTRRTMHRTTIKGEPPVAWHKTTPAL